MKGLTIGAGAAAGLAALTLGGGLSVDTANDPLYLLCDNERWHVQAGDGPGFWLSDVDRDLVLAWVGTARCPAPHCRYEGPDGTQVNQSIGLEPCVLVVGGRFLRVFAQTVSD